jgi:hypothetical protein
MVSTVAPADEADLSRLFAAPARWGYEYVEPVAPTQSPERSNPPSRREVRRVPRSQAAGLREAAVLAAVGGVGALFLESELGVFSGGAKGTVAGGAVVIVHLAAAAVAYWAALAWQRSSLKGESTEDIPAVRRNLVPGINALATFFAPYLVLPVEAVIAWRRIWRGGRDLVPHPGDARRAEAEYQEAMSAWQQRVVQFEAAEVKRSESVDVWYPVPLSQAARMTCVFGGTPVSWTAVLSAVGASLLGSGARIVIGDLSRRLTADVLCDLCRAVGIPTVEAVLPGGAANADLFADVSWNDLSSVLAEVLHSAQKDLDASRRERQEDRSVIRDIAGCLDASGPVSITRLRKALLVVQGVEVAGNGDAVIDADEYERLTRLFNEVQRQHGGVMERVTRIERALRDFELLDGTDTASANDAHAALESSPGVSGDRGDLRVIGVDKQTDDLENDRLVDLLFQLLLRRVRRGWAQADVLIILGADRIRREALESLMTHAEQERIEVLLFFEHLRQDAIDIVGGGGAIAAFLALGNHREAKEASDFIGGEYRWVEAQHTASASESLTRTPGREESASSSGTLGLPPAISRSRSKTKGRSYSEAFGQHREYTLSEQRVREAVIEPEILMGLPVTGMICVEVLPGGQRTAVNIDCHPQIAFAPRVAKEPRASTAAS